MSYINQDIISGTRTVNLIAGTHLMDSATNNYVYLEDETLEISGIGLTSILKREDNTVTKDWEQCLGVRVANATELELNSATWFTEDGIDYCIIQKGDVVIKDLTLDANMFNQNYGELNVEHAAVFQFNGRIQDLTGAFVGKKAILALNSVLIENVHIINRDQADVFWVGRAYSKPNIANVTLRNVTEDGTAVKRGSLGLSGRLRELIIEDCNFRRLETEATCADCWVGAPGSSQYSEKWSSFWVVKNSTFHKLDFAVKGHETWIDFDNVTISSTKLYQAGGVIQNSELHFSYNDRVLNRPLNLTFLNCDLYQDPNPSDHTQYPDRAAGLEARGENREKEGGNITFQNCNFYLNGSPKYGSFITQQNEGNTSEQIKVDITIINCEFEPFSWLENGDNSSLDWKQWREVCSSNTYGVVEFVNIDEKYRPYFSINYHGRATVVFNERNPTKPRGVKKNYSFSRMQRFFFGL